MIEKGRSCPARGSRLPHTILTERSVIEIKNMLAVGVPGTRLAKLYGVSCGAIYGIKEGRNWKWVKQCSVREQGGIG